jgi:hypothetical protein
MIGYHFTNDRLRDGSSIPAIGEWLVHYGEVIPCVSGLHMSKQPWDALKYAPGNMIHKVELEVDLISHGSPVDKWVGRRRRIIASFDGEKLLRSFARWCALDVIHLWDAPIVVVEYLKTGDEGIRLEAAVESWTAEAESWTAVESWAAEAAKTAVESWEAAWEEAWEAATAAAWTAAVTLKARAAAMKKYKKRFHKIVKEEFKL